MVALSHVSLEVKKLTGNGHVRQSLFISNCCCGCSCSSALRRLGHVHSSCVTTWLANETTNNKFDLLDSLRASSCACLGLGLSLSLSLRAGCCLGGPLRDGGGRTDRVITIVAAGGGNHIATRTGTAGRMFLD